ncbi:phenylacetate-coenzyme A ligase PaaK-like adenylate-forming protein [Streptosporangium album]|uniref:Phenylacetate-coenzyme A ligase PaaK-like adenylate-forming protein n=1 Tax=Streptosporangium album TaxID=47479 RepID=A0A7W7S2N5_9ACTN|nr:phenylacetate--CoA ligase family protein [Streptosporangium album]MBB4942680.1 phenylacetate-coenzyme A ligase PaaK-like adenylate-forming protein [Streptosporangium album]
MGEDIRQLRRDSRRAHELGPAAIQERQRANLAEMVTFARAASPYFRELYRDLPDRVDDPAMLPITTKQALMDRFDDWVTDREVTFEQVQTFVDDPGLVGERFLGKYMVAHTSGTTGVLGYFLLDDRNMAVNVALGSLTSSGMNLGVLMRILARRGRMAMICAPNGHGLSLALALRFQKRKLTGRLLRIISIYRPLPELVAELNAYSPAMIMSSPSVLSLLAGQQEKGRLRIRPAVVFAAGETVTTEDVSRFGDAFDAGIAVTYSTTECGFLSYGCGHGWYHVNSDWAVLEPVDADYRPTPPGEPSHTVLLSNLANRVQPILRYDLGDSVVVRPDPCPCGDPRPAVRVQGRTADVLTFPGGRGEPVSIAPMAIGALVDHVPGGGIEQFQIVQTTPTNLRVRLTAAADADADHVWKAVRAELTQLLTEHEAGDITLERADEPPQLSASGKFREVIPLSQP